MAQADSRALTVDRDDNLCCSLNAPEELRVFGCRVWDVSLMCAANTALDSRSRLSSARGPCGKEASVAANGCGTGFMANDRLHSL